MTQVIQCIPNFSEGRRADCLAKLVATAKSTPGVMLVDEHTDASHNRTVLTLLGDPAGIKAVALALAACALAEIDMTLHRGEHPRMGALDVLPLVPIKGVTMDDCVKLSKEIGQAIGEMGIPVFLYEESATSDARRNLADVRRGQFEGLMAKMQSPAWQPDFGPANPHPTAGAVAVSARHPMIAFNANLSTSDIEIANYIAKKVRGSSGGLKYCKAIGIMLHERNTAQVSMNLVNYKGTSIYTVLELIKAEAARFGVCVTDTELIGIAPARALIDCAEYYLQIKDFDYTQQVLDNHLLV